MLGVKRRLENEQQFPGQNKVARKEVEIEDLQEDNGVTVVETGGKSCTHEVIIPEGVEYTYCKGPPPESVRNGREPAKTYDFPLDPFQKVAANCLEAGHSVLVSAHTSAGKTVVAEYAFAMAVRDGARVIYTSPLKALGNQKYRQFAEMFADVGLMTGDITINPEASCLVMTTEILRSMLYRGSLVVREVQLIIFDEIHYLRDKERGVVWEECIIMLPQQCQYVFLSATIPNAREFAQWVTKTHKQICHVVYTDYRPVPLQHYMFPSGGDGLHLVVDEQSRFREDNFRKAVAALGESAMDFSRKKLKETEEADIFRLVTMIMLRGFDPVILFCFSKKECEANAVAMAAMDLTDDTEKKLIEGVSTNALDILSEDDRKLPQITAAVPMLKRGIGIHHSGLLPILKELVEILFQEGLLKVLFATETFSTGLNMPAKTVVFTGTKKFDGGQFRSLTGGEYTQMSGRAGRRGLDDRGIVILMLDVKIEPAVARNLVKGAPDPLISEFKLGYNMLISILRMESGQPEQMIRHSYRQFLAEHAIPELERKEAELQSKIQEQQLVKEEQLESYVMLLKQIVKLQEEAAQIVNQPKHVLPFLQPGRLVKVLSGSEEYQYNAQDPLEIFQNKSVWGAIVNFQHNKNNNDNLTQETKENFDDLDEEDDIKLQEKQKFVVDILVNVNNDNIKNNQLTNSLLLEDADSGVPAVVGVTLDRIVGISSVRIYLQKDLKGLENRKQGVRCIAESIKRLKEKMGGVPSLDPIEEMGIKTNRLKKCTRKSESLQVLLAKSSIHRDEDLVSKLRKLIEKQHLQQQIKEVQNQIQAAKDLILKDELRSRIRVLRRLGYLENEGVVTLKGQIVAGIQGGDELLIAELIMDGVFNDLEADQSVALLSCLLWQEAGDATTKVREDMLGAFGSLRQAAKKIAKVSCECKLEIDEKAYVNSFKPRMIDGIISWCRGQKFAQVIKICGIYEGSLVRLVRRLEELLGQLVMACKTIGDEQLANKFEEGANMIKRDVIFAASLYL